jgi:hypothetical protein
MKGKRAELKRSESIALESEKKRKIQKNRGLPRQKLQTNGPVQNERQMEDGVLISTVD